MDGWWVTSLRFVDSEQEKYIMIVWENLVFSFLSVVLCYMYFTSPKKIRVLFTFICFFLFFFLLIWYYFQWCLKYFDKIIFNAFIVFFIMSKLNIQEFYCLSLNIFYSSKDLEWGSKEKRVYNFERFEGWDKFLKKCVNSSSCTEWKEHHWQWQQNIE